MDARVLEILNQIIVLIIYGIVLSREITNHSFDLPNTLITIGGIVFSVILMFFTWFFKAKSLVE